MSGILHSLNAELGTLRVFWGSPEVWLTYQSHYGGVLGEYIVVVCKSLEPGTGNNFLNLGNFGSISASVQQKNSRLGRSLSGKHTALRHLKIMCLVCYLNCTKPPVVVVDFSPL